MSGSLFELVLCIPPHAEPRGTTRKVLRALAWFADRGILNPSQEWLAQWAMVTPRRVVDLLASLVSAGWVSRIDGRTSNGRMKRNEYKIAVERLSVSRAPWAKFIVPYLGDTVALKPGEIDRSNAAEISLEPDENGSESSDEISHGAVYKERAYAGARPNPSSHPSFRNYPWPSEEMRMKAERILAVCGPGLADVEKQHVCLWPSLENLLKGRWGNEEFLRLEVIPMVARKTEKPREEDKRLREFYPIDRSISEAMAQRSGSLSSPVASGQSQQRKVAMRDGDQAPFKATTATIDATRRNLDRMLRGEWNEWLVAAEDRQDYRDGGEARERACAKVLAATKRLLAELTGVPLLPSDM